MMSEKRKTKDCLDIRQTFTKTCGKDGRSSSEVNLGRCVGLGESQRESVVMRVSKPKKTISFCVTRTTGFPEIHGLRSRISQDGQNSLVAKTGSSSLIPTRHGNKRLEQPKSSAPQPVPCIRSFVTKTLGSTPIRSEYTRTVRIGIRSLGNKHSRGLE